jgi:hypothetical protein
MMNFKKDMVIIMESNKKDFSILEIVGNDLLDRFCEIEGTDEAIKWLLLSGYSVDELITLQFDKGDVKRIDSRLRKKGAY